MNIDWKTNLYCLIGAPVSESLSPKIHNYYFKTNKLNSVYLAFNIEKNDLETVLEGFKAMDIRGFNVTIPHKIKIIDYLDEISREAKLLGAVNTVRNENGKLIGYNTDGMGFIKTLKDRNIKINEKSFLIIGAGGAAYAISMTLALEGAKKIIIVNKTEKRAKKLVNKIKTNFKDIEVYYMSLYENLKMCADIDIIVNCTPVGMEPNIDNVPINLNSLSIFNKNIIIYDIIYKPLKTKFLKCAEEKGFETINGLDMLINQAILSQQIWGNIRSKNVGKNLKKIKGFLTYIVE